MEKTLDLERLEKAADTVNGLLKQSSDYISGINDTLDELSLYLADGKISKDISSYEDALNALKDSHQQFIEKLREAPKALEENKLALSEEIANLKAFIETSNNELKEQIADMLNLTKLNVMETVDSINDIPVNTTVIQQPAAQPVAPVKNEDYPLDLKYLSPTKNDYAILEKCYADAFDDNPSVNTNTKTHFFGCIKAAFFGGFGYYQTQALQKLACKMMYSSPKDLKRFLNEHIDDYYILTSDKSVQANEDSSGAKSVDADNPPSD